MNPRKSIRADAVIDREGPVYVLDANDRVRRVTHAQVQDDGKVLVVYAGKSWDEMSPDVHLFLASPAQIQAHEDERDRLRVADKLRVLGERIVRDRLPVPVSLARVTVGFDLDDEQDLTPWAKALGRDPVRPDFPFDPVIESTEFGVKVQLLGGRRAPEVKPDGCAINPWGDNLGCPMNADNMHHCNGTHRHRQHWCACGAMVIAPDVERTDSVGAFPITGEGAPVGEVPALPYGFAVSDGHRPKVSDDAMQHDGRYDNGRAEA